MESNHTALIGKQCLLAYFGLYASSQLTTVLSRPRDSEIVMSCQSLLASFSCEIGHESYLFLVYDKVLRGSSMKQ